MSDIYEDILNHAASWVEVARPDGAGGWTIAAAPLKLVEQDPGSVTQPLFAEVAADLLTRPVVATVAALFNNYNPFEGQADIQLSNLAHSQEIEALLDVIMPTAPMQLAVNYLRTAAPSEFPDEAAVRVWTRQVWFEPFVNEYAAPEADCCGFEHVFVGEVQQGANPGDNKMDIGGYHSWVKYVSDQTAGLVAYRGHDYPASVKQAGKESVREASVVMTWSVDGVVYLKNPGGFFVGDLPEMQFALGIVGVFDSLRDQFGGTGASGKKTDRKVKFGDQFIDLVVYPQTVASGSARKVGAHLRSMYPKFRGSGAGGGQAPGPTLPHTPHNNGPLRIARALPNPAGTDETGEWVELINITQHTLDLAGWSIADAQGRSLALQGTVGTGETFRVLLDRTVANSVQLGNNGGWILLFNLTERVAAVRYGNASNNQVIEF